MDGRVRLGLAGAVVLLGLVFGTPAGGARAAGAPEPDGPLVNEIGLAWTPLGQPTTWDPAGRKRFEGFAPTVGRDPLVVLGDRGAYWVDADGALIRRTSYRGGLGWLQAVRFRRDEGWTFVGATDSYAKKLLLQPEDGSPPARIALEGHLTAIADVVGDEELEVVANAWNALLFYDRRGRLLRRLATGMHTDAAWPVEVDGTAPAELLTYHFVTRKDGTTLTVRDADGEIRARWHEAKSSRYSVCQWRSPSTEIIASLDDELTVRDARGRVVKQYRVPGIGTFRHVRTGEFGGDLRVALVISGSCPARLLVFGPDDRLVYHERLDGWADLWANDPNGAVFYVTIGDTIRRYVRLVTSP